MVVGLDGQLGEPLGLPGEHLVGHALERLAEHHEAVALVGAGAEVDVGQPALAPAAAPLDGQHDEVEGVHRLDLDPGGAATTGVVRARRPTSRPRPRGRGRGRPRTNSSACSGESVTRLGVRCCSGTRSASAAQRSVPGRSSRLVPSRWSRSKKYGVTWTPLSMAVRDAVSWNGRGRPSSVEGQRLAVEHEPLGRQRAHDVDHLGQPVGDHVEGAGGDQHVVAGLVHLDADAVELGVDRDGAAAGLGHRRGHVGRARRQHRQDRPADLEPELAQRGLALERRPGDRHGAAREHGRAADGLERRAATRPPGPPGPARRGRPGGRCR